MIKLPSFFIIYIVIGITLAHNLPSAFFPGFFAKTSICVNSTTQAAYLTKALTLITQYEANSTYNSILKLQTPNFVAYLKNPTNQLLLYSNCTAFVSGLKAAKSADNAAERTRLYLIREIYLRFRQIPREVTGRNGPNELDSNEYHPQHYRFHF